jgi:hypothetical protein
MKFNAKVVGSMLVGSVFVLGFYAGQSMSQEKVPTDFIGVTSDDPVVLDLGPELKGHKVRIRVFHIAGKGTVGLHSHKDSPSLAHYYGAGVLSEFDSTGKYVGERGGGKTYVDDTNTNHFYLNKTDGAVNVVVADVIKE